MSINIHFRAVRDIQVIKTGEITQEFRHLGVWQTPTEVTREIMNNADPIKAYADWAAAETGDEQAPIYAEDDIWCEGEPVGFETVNVGKVAAAEFLETVKILQAEGFDIVAEAW